MAFLLSASILILAILSFLYLRLNDSRLNRTPPMALAISPKRVSSGDVHADARSFLTKNITTEGRLPPKTGRRYIVVGGTGFLGGWIVNQLLERGEHRKRIRIIDLRPPARADIEKVIASGVDFHQIDISDPVAVEKAFLAPWSTVDVNDGNVLSSQPPLTVFHTAASIRFYERHPDLVSLSAKVNVQGTQNIINSSQSAGADVLVYTSSGSVALRRVRLWLWPWESEPQNIVQAINDDDEALPKQHDHFFSNYAVTKLGAEKLVRAADKTPTEGGGGVLRTGALRPGNGIYGPRGDTLCGAFLVRKTTPDWIGPVVQSFIYVENCALAHLCYEQRLIDLLPPTPSSNTHQTHPDIGGQAFSICDAGPPPTFGDVYTTLTTLSKGEVTFPKYSPSLMLLVSQLVELYYLAQRLYFPRILPPVTGDIINLQPPLFLLTSVHMIFDDSRARLPPEKGGLGYAPLWTTMEGLHQTYKEHVTGLYDTHRAKNAGVSIELGIASWLWRKMQGMLKRVEVEIGRPDVLGSPAIEEDSR